MMEENQIVKNHGFFERKKKWGIRRRIILLMRRLNPKLKKKKKKKKPLFILFQYLHWLFHAQLKSNC